MGEFIDFAVVVLPTVIAVLSVLVAIKLTKGERLQGWWVLIIVLGIGASILTWVSQSRARNEHDKELGAQRQGQSELRTKLDESLLSREYMRGQLESLSLMVRRTGAGDPGMKRLSDSIAKLPLNNGERPHVISVVVPHASEFQIPSYPVAISN